MPNDDLLVFAADPNEEHRNILDAKAATAEGAWELGSRLLRFRETGEWRKVAVGAAHDDWTDYLRNGVRVSLNTAYKYMDAAKFPRWCSRQQGVEKISWLAKIVELTAVDETPEQATALELPAKGGGTRPFVEMNAEEVEEAYRLMRDGDRPARRPKQVPSGAAVELQRRAAEAVAAWLKPGQVAARESNGALVLDVKGVPQADAPKVFGALAGAITG